MPRRLEGSGGPEVELRFLVFTNDFPPTVGGVQVVAYQLSRHLVQAGADVSVLARAESDPKSPLESAAEFDARQAFRITRFAGDPDASPLRAISQRLNALRALERAVDAEKPDGILCVQWDPCGYLARLLGVLARRVCPYYVIAHGMEIVQQGGVAPKRQIKGALRRFALGGARRIVAVSPYTRDRVLALGIAPGRVVVIPNGAEWCEDLPLDPHRAPCSRTPTLLSIARLVSRKGQDMVLRALPELLATYPSLVYHIVGSGPERERLERLVSELGVGEHVVFHGTLVGPAKEEWLAKCDVFVLPCRETATDFEPFGIVYLEAMQHARPVVAGRSGGVPGVVVDGETGILVDPYDSTAIAAGVRHVLDNPAEARRLGRNGWQAVRDRFRWEVVVREYLAVLADGLH